MKVPCVRLQNIFLIMSNVIPNLTAVYQAQNQVLVKLVMASETEINSQNVSFVCVYCFFPLLGRHKQVFGILRQYTCKHLNSFFEQKSRNVF